MLKVDYFEFAKEMLYRLEVYYPQMRITEESESVFEIAELLVKYIDPELLGEINGDDLGIGIIIGMLSILYHEYKDELTDESDGEKTKKDQNFTH